MRPLEVVLYVYIKYNVIFSFSAISTDRRLPFRHRDTGCRNQGRYGVQNILVFHSVCDSHGHLRFRWNSSRI